ncbi:DEAD/DEAH box helicase [Nocardia cyriacigeorgica]|uniref:DEAD/DEAH box helicase n=1 Tax=Nocardia cyriacigeorgica TaxID=135487 RepID=UPI0024544054|nr:DEAD/DEAH box helicase [Nocardia cyriacigeorgica]
MSDTPSVAVPTSSFAEFGVRASLVEAMNAAGITGAFPIQAATLPDTMAGRDVLARGKTGSGKTLAFSIPMVERLAGATSAPGRPAGLILAPTRELATQIAATVDMLARPCGLRVVTIFGGVPVNRQTRELRAGADIVVACPGRLEDLMRQGVVALDAVQIAILDEADHMADLGFLPAVTRILTATPADGQRLLFSATLDNEVDRLVKRFLRKPVTHSVDTAASPVPTMTHHVFEVDGADAKKDLVRALASGTGRRILFMRTKHHARRLAKQLTASGIPAADLHGNLSQAARDRNLSSFADGSTRVLVATDIAARGVHVDDVELVVHVDPPAEHKAYLHRSGRTARAGGSGDVVTVVLPDQRKDVAMLLRKAGLTVAPQRASANSPAVTALVGAIAAPEHRAAAADDRADNRGSGARGARRGNRPAANLTEHRGGGAAVSGRRNGGARRGRPAAGRTTTEHRLDGRRSADHGNRSAGQGNRSAGQGQRRDSARGAGEARHTDRTHDTGTHRAPGRPDRPTQSRGHNSRGHNTGTHRPFEDAAPAGARQRSRRVTRPAG